MPISNEAVRPILVTGATGKTGRRVAARLRDAGETVRLGSRSSSPAFDWTDPATWSATVDGVRSIYLAYQPDLAVPGALETVNAFLAQARSAGVEHVVLLSGRGEVEAEDAERALRASGINWTVIRASWFYQNFSESFFAEGIGHGQLVVPQGLAAEPFVDADDIAEIAARALTEDGHRGKLYEVTGPEALTFAQTATALGEVTGRQISCVEVPIADYLAALRTQGLPPEACWLVEYLFSTVLDGRNTPLADGVQSALGRRPRSIYDFATTAAAHGAWAVAA